MWLHLSNSTLTDFYTCVHYNCFLQQIQVEDMKKQLQSSMQENTDLLNRLETLSHLMDSIGEIDRNATWVYMIHSW